MPSATFHRVYVRENGLRYLMKSEIVGTLRRGGTSAGLHSAFQEKNVFKVSTIGEATVSAYSFTNQLGRLSGTPAREVLTALRFLVTFTSVADVATRIFSGVNALALC